MLIWLFQHQLSDSSFCSPNTPPADIWFCLKHFHICALSLLLSFNDRPDKTFLQFFLKTMWCAYFSVVGVLKYRIDFIGTWKRMLQILFDYDIFRLKESIRYPAHHSLWAVLEIEAPPSTPMKPAGQMLILGLFTSYHLPKWSQRLLLVSNAQPGGLLIVK